MCAINGFTGEDEARIKRMNAATAHRGPDATATLLRDGVALGHNRLSVIDLSPDAAQPMLSRDSRYAIVYNGELYNYKELREQLSGYPFRTSGDTEVVLAAFERWGTGAFARFNGMFALAIHDRKERSITLARDIAGVKPLYYAAEGKTLAFSSEVGGMAAYGASRALDLDSFDLYLRLQYVPGPRTAFAGIRKLRPGTYAVWKDGILTETSYQSPEALPDQHMTFSQAKSLVREAVDESVRRQLVSDRPLGIYLSGGIDSSVILDAASRLRPGIDTFSIGFALAAGEEQDKFNADSILAAKTAERYGASHHEFQIAPEEVLPALESAALHLGEPLANPTVVPMILLAQRTKAAGVDVVLGGDGGDELFGGYERYRWSVRADTFRSIPGPVRNLLIGMYPPLRKLNDEPGMERYMRFHFQKENTVQEIMGSGYRDGEVAKRAFADTFFSAGGDSLVQFMRADREAWLVDESLLKSDRLSMAHGVEARVPFLDAVVLDAAARVPSRYKTTLFDTKVVLKEAFRNRLPEYLFSQPKRGWQSPGAKWLRYPHIAAYAREVLSAGYHAGTDPLFDWDAVGTMLDAHIEHRRYSLTMLWSILSFRIWAREYNVTL